MLVKMIYGTYGYRNETGGIEVKDARSAPFELGGPEAERLVRMGYAVQADSIKENPREETADARLDPEQFRNMSKKNLEKLAKDMGLISYGTKEEIIARIVEAEIDEPDSEEEPDGTPDLKPAEPEA